MKKQEITELLKHTEFEKICSFVAEHAAADHYFYEKIKKALLPDSDQKTCNIEYYRGKAEDCFDFARPSSRGRRSYEYDFYEATYEAASGLNKLLNDASFYAKQGKYADASALAMAVVEVIPRNYEMVDDSDGELGAAFNQAIELLRDIVNNMTSSICVKKEIYNWSKTESSNSVYSDYGFDEIHTIYEICCEQLGDTDEVLADIDRQIEEAKNEYRKREAVLRKIRFMQSKEIDIQSVMQSHLDINEVRRIRFDQFVHSQEYDEALHIAEQGIEIAKQQNHFGTVTDWQKSKYDIYLLQGDTANLLPMAEYLFLTSGGRHGKEEFYNTLREYTPAVKWPETLERLFVEAEKGRYFDSFAARIMHEHHMWSRLFIHCHKGNISSMEKYEKDLKPYFEKEILEVYRDYVEKQALITDYNAYQEVARILKRMRTFIDGDELVNQLLEKYRTTYRRRKNMMAALKDV